LFSKAIQKQLQFKINKMALRQIPGQRRPLKSALSEAGAQKFNVALSTAQISGLSMFCPR
jgi:hypothetical protein